MRLDQLLAQVIDDAHRALDEGFPPTVRAPDPVPLDLEPTEDAVDDITGALETLASFAKLPDPLPDPGSGWVEHTRLLRIAAGEAAAVVEQLVDAVPGSERAKPGKVLDALASIADAADEQIKAGVQTLSGGAVFKAAKAGVARAITLAWAEAAAGLPVYRADQATASQILGKMTSEERALDYRQRLGLFQGIVLLGKKGIVDLLRTAPEGGEASSEPVSGTAIVILAAVAILVVFAAVMVWWFSIEDRQKNWEAMCIDEKGRPIEKMREICANLLKQHEGFDWSGVAIGLGAALVGLMVIGRH